ncbi:hypothetical protein AAI421_17930 [Rhodococcus aetherivorans]|uniref:hypothetical protein n=1 Tax=Rhodococcus aetherivorans TaxID=191292 RepID=UPI0031DBDACE
MNSPARYTPIAAPASQRANVSQATAIEQSRAVAEVQASVLVAQQNPRNKSFAIAEMREVCGMKSVAERAFFKFPRAGETVSGASIHLARELARCWGNIQFGVTELRRDDVKGESEMQAYAWDLETNARTATTFIVPHKRDTKKGVRELVDMRDIYENNANNGARRLREAIFTVLPGWFVDEAQELCRATLDSDGGSKVPLAQRIADCIAGFERLGVTRAQIEAKLERKSSEWTERDLSELGVSFRSIRAGDLSRDDEFPPARITAAEIAAAQAPAAEAPAAAEPEPVPAEKTKRQQQAKPSSRLCGQLGRALIDGGIAQGETVSFLSARVGRPVEGAADLTIDEIHATIAFLKSGEEPVDAAPETAELPLEGAEQ